jgi:DNA-binding NarL/FixJ family response regulator
MIIGSQPDMLLVAQAANAIEALEQFRRHKPDVTLMDLRLPGTNGTDALIAIRGEFPTAKVVMLTTSDCDAEIQRALRKGAAGYLLKSRRKASCSMRSALSTPAENKLRAKWRPAWQNMLVKTISRPGNSRCFG